MYAKKRLSALLLAAVFVFVLSAPALSAPALSAEIQPGAESVIALYENKAETWADAIALYSAGVEGFEYGGEFAGASVSSLATEILAKLAASKDLEKHAPCLALAGSQQPDGSFGTIYEQVYAMLALDKTCAYDREKAVQWLERQQLDDGGFAAFGETGDVDTTAMMLLVLRGEAAEKAVEFILGKLTKNSGFVSPWSETKKENSCTIATVISGFVACGQPVTDAMKQNLLSFQRTDGSFSYEPKGEEDDFSTQQALIAMGDLLSGSSVYARLPSVYYADQDKISSWALEKVKASYERNYLRGSAAFFRPKDMVTRAELAAVITKMADLDTSGVYAAFKDVSKADWFFEAVAAAARVGYMPGKDMLFRPRDPVTRQEIAVVLSKVFSLKPGGVKPNDSAQVSPDCLDAVSAVMSEGIMNGSGGSFSPKSALTREELAVILCGIYE